MKKRMILFLISWVLTCQSAYAVDTNSNEKLSVFMTSCAYGTGAGALLGLASLAFVDDPSSKMGNIARGASLGLYAGIGLGFYLVYARSNSTTSSDFSFLPIFYPTTNKNGKMDGLAGVMDVYRF